MNHARRTGWLLACLALGCADGTSPQRRAAPATAPAGPVRPVARVETDPVPHGGDAADDPAVWVHPTDPARSLVLGTDKRGALHAYDMEGRLRQTVGEGTGPNNVDVVRGFPLGARRVDLAVVTVRSHAAFGVKAYVIDAETGRLADATAGGAIGVLPGDVPYGICGYRSRKTGRTYVFVTGQRGAVGQYVLRDAGGGKVDADHVRTLEVDSVAEGCVADDELGVVYVAEETVGIWKFPADPDGGDAGRLVAKVGEHGLTADVEGLALYRLEGGRGFLIAASQGSDELKVYARGGENRFLLTVDPRADGIDDATHTDGVAVTSRPTSKRFPAGVLVVQDDDNDGANQNFKLYDWRDVAPRRVAEDARGD